MWVAPALVPDAVERLAAEEPEPLAEVAVEFAGETATVRVVVNAPATLGEALRDPAPEAAGEVAGAPSAPVPAPPSGAPAAASAEGPGTLSYTALAFYERCPLRFRAQRVLGLPDVPPPGAPPKPRGLEPRDRGVLVHELLEELDLAAGGPPRPERVAALARELGLEAGRADLERAAELAGAFAAAPVARRLAGARHEVEFAFELSPAGGAALLTGAVDVLAVEPDGAWLVVDAKTDTEAIQKALRKAVEEKAVEEALEELLRRGRFRTLYR